MKTSNRINDFFASRLKDHSPTPPKHLWDRIEAAMPEEKPRNKKKAVLWHYAAASIFIALVAGITLYYDQNYNQIKSTYQPIAIKADTIKLPVGATPVLPPLIADNNTHKPEANPEQNKKAQHIVQAKARKSASKQIKKLQPSASKQELLIAVDTKIDDGEQTVQTAAPAKQVVLANQEEASATNKVVIEIRSGYRPQQEELFISAKQSDDSRPAEKKGKVLRIFKRLKDIKNGDEEIELDRLKDNLFALVTKDDKKANK
jgi:hypothetical protein